MNVDSGAISDSDISSTPTPTFHSLLYNRRQDSRRERGEGGEEMVQGWSDTTLTGPAQSGRYSAWSAEEGEYNRVTTEKVDRMFRCLNRALFEGRDSGSAQTDKECREWALTFPHLQVRAEHLFDNMDDGTEIAEPIYRDDSSDTITNERSQDAATKDIQLDELAVAGRHIDPISLSDSPEEDALKEEILAQHGVLEEYIAFDNSSAESGGQGKRRWKFSRPPPSSLHQPPTVSPEAGIHQVVSSQLFDVLWSEVVTILLPLVIATRDKALKVQSSRQSMQTSLAASHSTSPHESSLLLSLPPPPDHHSSHHNSQFYGEKLATSSLAVPPAGLPRLVQHPPPLSGLMHIRPVSLRHRNMSLLQQSERMEEILSRLSIHHNDRNHPSALLHHQPPDSALYTNPRLPRHLSGLPSTPPGLNSSHRGIYSGRGGLVNPSRRPQQLKPLERPRTPALERIESAQIRGYRLPVNAAASGGGGIVGLSPPPTAGGGVAPGGGVAGSGHVRNTQLPPLEIGGGAATTGVTLTTERSPPVVRGKSTFSQWNSSAAFSELQELRRLQLPGGVRSSDHLRPSTSSSSSNFRADSGKPLGGKKLSDPTSRGGGGGGGGGGGMKIVGYATGVSYSASSVGGASSGVEGAGSSGKVGGGLPYSIAEDQEEWTEEEAGRLNVTGHSSAFLKSKTRSVTDSRSKHRGHGR